MFKKISSAFFAFIYIVLLCQARVYAQDIGNINDYMEYLTDSEETGLKADIDKVRADYGLDVVIVITDNVEGKSSMNFADDFYDYNGFGVGSDFSGLLMLVNMKDREVWISTTGKAIDIFTDSRISNMVDNVTKFLSDGRYYNACSTFIGDVRNYADMGIPQGQYREENGGTGVGVPVERRSYLEKAMGLMGSGIVYVIALIISIIVTIIVSLSSKGKVTISNRTYEEDGSFVLTGTSDNFLRERTTRTKIESGSSSGRSSTHSGSSGRSHGGGGGRF